MWCIQAFIYFPRYGATLSNASRRDLSPFCTRPPTMVRSDIAQLTPGRDALRHPRSDERCLCSLSLVPSDAPFIFFAPPSHAPHHPHPHPFSKTSWDPWALPRLPQSSWTCAGRTGARPRPWRRPHRARAARGVLLPPRPPPPRTRGPSPRRAGSPCPCTPTTRPWRER